MGAMSDVLIETENDGVLVLTMNRPDRLNALNAELLGRLHAALARAATDSAVGAVLLTGAGNGFCAGGDVKSMASDARSEGFERRAAGLRQWMESSRLLHDMPKPTIAAIRGACAGAGHSLALACDIRIASETAKLTTAFAKVGLSGDFGGSYFLTSILGAAKARELYLTSPILDAAEAMRLGLLYRVVADAALDAEALALARRLAAGPRVTYAYIKRNMAAAENGSLTDVMDLEAMHHTRCTETEDHKEAARAFVEKRAPVFRGR
jgi:2-(1,2-epoxy-1,2-dihydrophenyl)acetyl-CoA isomerase